MKSENWRNWLLGATVGLTLTAVSAPALLAQTASLLPNAVQYFMDGNGKPLANGKVFFYEPGGTTPKTTWTTASESVPQANPVILGTSGRPVNPIYGDGSYRQIVKDQFNNVIWDFNTASAGGGTTAPAFSEGVMVGTLVYWANTVLPGKYLYAAGQAVSRTTYASLFTALSWNPTILCSTGVATITVSTEISDKVPIGAPVEFSCFAPGTTVLSKTSGQLTLSNNATTTTSTAGFILPWGNGDGSTTFNVPDMRGRAPLGRDNMNGSPIGRLVASVYGSNPDAMNAAGGSLSTSLGLNQVPQGITSSGSNSISVTSTVAGIPTNAVPFNAQRTDGAGTGIVGPGGATTPVTVSAVTSTNAAQAISVTSSNTGKGQAASATVGAGGAGYSAGTQLLSVAGGTCTTVPQFSVTIVAGAITAPTLTTAGQCTVVPSNPAATTGGGGTGGTLNVTYAPLPLGTIPPSITSDWIVKALPDDTPGGTGVTSINGMIGAITCGAGITCTANTISAATSGTANLWPLFSTGASTPPAYRPIVGSDLPNPSTTTLGAVFSAPVSSNSVLSGIGNDGQPTFATTTGTGDVVRATNPTISNLTIAAPFTITGANAKAIAIGRLGATTPAFSVNSLAANQITGLVVTGQASGNGVNLSAVGETNVPFAIDAAGTGPINIAGTSTGAVSIFRNTLINHDTNPTLTLGSAGGSLAHLTTPGTAGMAFTTNSSTDQVTVLHTASANRQVTMTGSNGGNPTIGTSAGNLAITPAVVGASSINGTMAANSIKCNNTAGVTQSIDCTAAQTQSVTSQGYIVISVTGVNANSANTDTAITVTLPTGYTKYRIANIFSYNPSISLTTATAGFRTGAGGTGTVVVTDAALSALTTNTPDTTGSFLNHSVINSTTAFFNDATLYYRIGTAQGSAATVDFAVYIQALK